MFMDLETFNLEKLLSCAIINLLYASVDCTKPYMLKY